MTEASARVRATEAGPLLHTLVARVAANAGLRVLAIKGPTLAVQGLRAARAPADVDVLVHPRELGPLVEELQKVGWRESLATTAPSIMPRHSVSVLNDHWPITVDVHHYFPGFLADAGEVFDELWARRAEVSLAGVKVPACDRVAHVAVVALHYLRDQRSSTALEARPELADLQERATSVLSPDELDELVGVARRLGAVATLRPFLLALDVPPSDLVGPVPQAELALWNLRVTAPDSYPWLLRLRRTPLRRWPHTIWNAIMLTEGEILTFHGDGRGSGSVTRLRWRRLRRGVRSIPRAVATQTKTGVLRRLRSSTQN